MNTEDKSKILNFSLRIHSADHLRRVYKFELISLKIFSSITHLPLSYPAHLILLDFILQTTLYDLHKSRSSSLSKMKTPRFIFIATVLQTYNLFPEKLLSF